MNQLADYYQMGMIALADAIGAGRLKAEDVTRHYLERIYRHNEDIVAYVHIGEAEALESARRIDQAIARGERPGPLAGVPFAVKDFSHVRGMPTSEGTRAFGTDHMPDDDEPMIARLRAAGAIPLGKTNVPEFGLHSATCNERFGISRNPWDRSRTPGGSSGGSSAAVSAGLASFATGSDGGGSIRTPAAFCGLVGLKTTTALVPRPTGRSDLSCLGYLTRSVRDTARLLDVSSGAHPADRRSINFPGGAFEAAIMSLDVRRLRITWSCDFGYAPMEDEIVCIAYAAYERLVKHAQLDAVEVPVELCNVYRAWAIDQLNFLKDELQMAGVDISLLDERSRRLLQQFAHSDPIEWLKARAAFDALEQQLASLFGKVDIIATPATSCPPFGASDEIPDRINGQDAEWTGAEPLSMFANIAGAPAISLPAGLTQTGLPVGLQLAGPRFSDHVLLRLAALFETCCPWQPLAPDYAAGP